MGLGIHTQQRIPYVLVVDRDKPQAERRTLVVRNLSARDNLHVEQLFEESRAGANMAAVVGKAAEGIRLALVGWSGFADEQGAAIPYDPAELDVVLSFPDLVEVRDELLVHMTTAEVDQKKSAWRSLSTTANSAAPTAKGGA